ncbi:MAG TPA: tRNA pseudouridine(55) synthase TruB [Gemmatimonadaceae bacterium]
MTSTDGLVLVDKPAGLTSHDVVAAVRRATGARRAGHTGTLDPFATGLLVVLTGVATRLARFVPGAPKTYDATIRFGVRTDTDDATGTPVASAPLPDESAVRAAMDRLTGTVLQVPPAYSAKHVGGRRAHAVARSGATVVLDPVPVEVHSWEVLAHDAETWQVRVTCGSGTYVRALARDLGQLSGSEAHLAALRRLRIGPFDVSEAVPVAEVRPETIRPMVGAVPHLPREVVDDAGVAEIRHGRAVPATVTGERAALVDSRQNLVALADRDGDRWQPRVVLVAA